MKTRHAATLLFVLVLVVTAAGRAAAQPAAPTPLAPADGANVTVPFTISWSAVSDPSGIVAYNWQVSASSNFSSVPVQNSTSGPTQDTVGGLANGTYFWRVQAVSGAFVQGAWSSPRTFTVTGRAPDAVATPLLQPTKAYSTFHPYETITFLWSVIPGAASYFLQASRDPSFDITTRIQFDNIPNPTMTFAIGNPEGNYFARVFAVDANRILGQPSNVINFSVFFNNPIGPPPSPISPANGAALTLPVAFTWADVPNPQPSGYELQVAKDSGFATIEFMYNQFTAPTATLTSLTPGTKFWRVRSAQGNASPTTAAETAWSPARSFTVSSAPPTPVSVSFTTNPLNSGDTPWVAVQLTAAVGPAGATISLSSSNQSAAPVPATVTRPPNTGWLQFQMQAGQVASPTPATITASINGGSASGQLTVQPTALQSLVISPSSISGGAQPGGIVMLTGQAPPGGASVTLSSNSPAVTPPASVFVAPGSWSVSFAIPTSGVSANTTATVTATWNGVSVQAPVTLTPQQPPTSLTLSPTSTVGLGGSSFGLVTIASPLPFAGPDDTFALTSSNPAVASVPTSVQIPAGTDRGGFNVFTSAVTVQTVVTISVSGGGVTQSATLTVTPSTPTLSSIALNPTSVVGGGSVQGTATLSGAAPSGGAMVTLASSNTSAATTPGSITVPAGATSVSFTVTTAAVGASTSVTISGASGGSTRSAVLTVSAPPPPASLSALSVTPTSVVGGTASQGKVTLTTAAPTGGAVVSLTSSSTVATVPASVTVASGATSATFTVTTGSVTASTSATISGAFGGTSRSAVLTITPPGQTATLTVTASGRSGESVSSSPAGLRVVVGSTGSAPFATGTAITLSISNGRDAVWSGACSSGGNETKACTFTLGGNATVSVNVQ